jgi:hypothetical protein
MEDIDGASVSEWRWRLRVDGSVDKMKRAAPRRGSRRIGERRTPAECCSY